MNDQAGSPPNYEFRKSLKDVHRYPVPEALRVERYLTRPLASLIVRSVYRSRIMPDHLTWASFVVGLSAAAAFLGGSQAYFVAGGILALLSSIFDCADGMLARARNQCTERGAFMDLMLDRIIDFIVLGAMAIGTYRFLGSTAVLIAALLAMALLSLQSTLYYLLLIYLRDTRMGRQAEVRGLYVVVVTMLSILNRPHYFFYLLIGLSLIGIFCQVGLFFRAPRR